MFTPCTPPDAAAIAAHYDHLDRFYRRLWGEHVHHGLWRSGRESPRLAVRRLSFLIANRLLLRPGDQVIDVGCGYGATSRLLAGHYGAQVLGLTLSQVQCDHAIAATSGGNPRFRILDWMDNDLPDASADGVVSIESLEHMADKRRFFSEALRVLRPGRRLVAAAWLAGESPTPWQVRHLIEPICDEGRLPGLCSLSEYAGIARSVGFEVIEAVDLSAQVRRTWAILIDRLVRGIGNDADIRRTLWTRDNRDWVFAITLGRIWLGYRLRAIGYGLFTCVKPTR